MDFDFSPQEQERFSALVGFAREHFGAPPRAAGEAPRAAGEFSRERWQKLAETGITGLPVPAEWGGRAATALDTSRAIEALAYGGVDPGLLFAACAHLFTCAVPIWQFGDDRQRERFLPPLARGEWVGANGTSEEEVGSDIGSIRATAEKRGDRYVLSGTKHYASNAPVADAFVVYANVNPKLGFGGLTGFIVERDTPGLHVRPAQDKIGLEGSPFGQIAFEGCEVPESQRLGVEGAGSAIFAESMRWERACLFALYVGSMERQLERCVRFVKGRRQFGQSIGKFQMVSSRIVDMKLRLETSRLLLYRASWLLQQGRRCDLDIALSKLHVSESAVQSALDAIQLHGGRGCLTEEGVEVGLRDAIPGRIFSGTSEIQRLIVARWMGL